jgi:hypothetical protein
VPAKPTLEQLERDVRQKLDNLHRRLIAPQGASEAGPPSNTPEERAAALARAVKKLRRAAYHARRARSPASLPLARELARIAESIQRNGVDVQLGDLCAMVGVAVAVEAETGEPVARRLAEAARVFEKLFMPKHRLSASTWGRQATWKLRFLSPDAVWRERRRQRRGEGG